MCSVQVHGPKNAVEVFSLRAYIRKETRRSSQTAAATPPEVLDRFVTTLPEPSARIGSNR
jgi:hypothetical protein